MGFVHCMCKQLCQTSLEISRPDDSKKFTYNFKFDAHRSKPQVAICLREQECL